MQTSEDQSVININLFPVVPRHCRPGQAPSDKQNTVLINKDPYLAGSGVDSGGVWSAVHNTDNTPHSTLNNASLPARGVSVSQACHCPVPGGCLDQPRPQSSPVTGFNHQVFVASNYQSALFPNDEQK